MRISPSPRKKKRPDESRKAFFLACGIYAPLIALLASTSAPDFAGAGSQATVALSFAQLSGGGPTGSVGDPVSPEATDPVESEIEPVQEPEPEPEPAPEPEPEPAPEPELA